MIVEALVRTRPGLGAKDFGDIITLKPLGSIWSDFEQKVHQLIKIDLIELKKKDAEISDKVDEIIAAFNQGETVVSNPFIKLDTTDPKNPITIKRSTIQVDFHKLPKKQIDDIKNQTKKVGVIDELVVDNLIVVSKTKKP